MALANKVVVIFGATGDVGSGAAHAYLQEGATVVAVSRDANKLENLRKSLGDIAVHLLPVTGEFTSDHTVAEIKTKVGEVLKGRKVDHVVTVLGFAKKLKPASESSLQDLKDAFEEGLYPNYLVATKFLSDLKDHDGASFTLVSGGLAHFCPTPDFWAATIKNSAVNALSIGLSTETQKDKVRVNTLCIHFGIAGHGTNKNRWGMDGADTYLFGPTFTAIAKSQEKGKIHCITSIDDAIKLAKTIVH